MAYAIRPGSMWAIRFLRTRWTCPLAGPGWGESRRGRAASLWGELAAGQARLRGLAFAGHHEHAEQDDDHQDREDDRPQEHDPRVARAREDRPVEAPRADEEEPARELLQRPRLRARVHEVREEGEDQRREARPPEPLVDVQTGREEQDPREHPDGHDADDREDPQERGG